MVTKSKTAGAKKTGRVKVGELKLKRETIKDLTDSAQKKVKGGVVKKPSGTNTLCHCASYLA